jgi:hypothetical protein
MRDKDKRNGVNKRFDFTEWKKEQEFFDRAFDRSMRCFDYPYSPLPPKPQPIRNDEVFTLLRGIADKYRFKVLL